MMIQYIEYHAYCICACTVQTQTLQTSLQRALLHLYSRQAVADTLIGILSFIENKVLEQVNILEIQLAWLWIQEKDTQYTNPDTGYTG